MVSRSPGAWCLVLEVVHREEIDCARCGGEEDAHAGVRTEHGGMFWKRRWATLSRERDAVERKWCAVAFGWFVFH